MAMISDENYAVTRGNFERHDFTCRKVSIEGKLMSFIRYCSLLTEMNYSYVSVNATIVQLLGGWHLSDWCDRQTVWYTCKPVDTFGTRNF